MSEELRLATVSAAAQGVVSHRRALLLWNPQSDSGGLICFSMKEMDCYYEPQEITEERATARTVEKDPEAPNALAL
ncbi:hypothetical protein NQZ68_039055 [Dissostichus eleginoides]|nr:hypothetical protein NQZ68_039055 [Dissostichus eleginoides]